MERRGGMMGRTRESLSNLSVLRVVGMLDGTASGFFSEFPAILLKPAMHADFRHTTAYATASRLRCRYRFTSAKQEHSRWWFFLNPRYLTFSKPKMRFRMRNGCSTFARTRAFTRFFVFSISSTKFLYFTLRLVISCAWGAACRIAPPCP